MPDKLKTLDNLNFDNTYTRLPEHFYHRVNPTPLKGAHLISFNPAVAQLLDLDACSVKPAQLAAYFGGQAALPGAEPLAMKYTGHQFGYYNPDLGDGRGLLLGEVLNQKGERWDLHLKGAGKTRYSRFGDGRAVLRSSIREYLVSEAMQGLNIPTTRALCLVGSEQQVMREGMEPCATVLRVSACHIRFGHFEYLYYSKRHDDLKELADYCIKRYYPEVAGAENPYLAMFDQVLERSAEMVAAWQAYGFVHGVLNTDNMSLLGETFDYGPYTFMDNYNPDFISNHTDESGRYAFKKQPDIVHWNLAALAQSLLPLVASDALKDSLGRFYERYLVYRNLRLRARLGLHQTQEGDVELIESLLQLFADQHVDFTRFFSHLCEFDGSESSKKALYLLVKQQGPLDVWLDTYQVRLGLEAVSQSIRHQKMRSVNPRYILRNYMAEEVIREASVGNYEPVNQLLAVLRHPGEQYPKMQHYASEPPSWAGAINLTCSS
ncbi:MAG: protein adenylyltransferase SelO [Pontibacterium sp.]